MRKLNQNGSFIIMLTLSFALLGTFIGFAVDFGRAYLQRARVNRLVDGAALAAAKALKGQAGLINDATRAACDSMKMNGAPVEMAGPGQCRSTSGAPFAVNLTFPVVAVAGGPPMTYVQVTGAEPVATTFMRFLGWMVPGDYSTINVSATAQAAPERPVDLVLVLDRSGSMTGTDASGRSKISSLKTAVNEFLDNNFTGFDRLGMVSFASRGCGSGGNDSTAANCTPDVAMDFATSTFISTLRNRVNALNAGGATNHMEAIRTARGPITQAFTDPTRATSRKAVLLVTDGKSTAMRRDNDAHCKQNPRTGAVITQWNSGTYASGCIQNGLGNTPSSVYIERETLGGGAAGSNVTNLTLFRDMIGCIRSLINCVTNGAMYEANLLRDCGYNNSACSSGGNHDVLVFVIGIGRDVASDPPNWRLDRNAKCLLARMANATDVLNTGNNTIQTIDTVCANPPVTTGDGDTWADLQQGWPCATGPCINSAQEKGKVYAVDMNGNVEAQLRQVFADVAAILKLRLTL